MTRIFLALRPRLTILMLSALPAVTGAEYITDHIEAPLLSTAERDATTIRGIPSGTPLDLLDQKDELAHVRLPDGTTGWVARSYLTADKPAQATLLELQAELAATRRELESSREGALDLSRQLDLERRTCEQPGPDQPPREITESAWRPQAETERARLLALLAEATALLEHSAEAETILAEENDSLSQPLWQLGVFLAVLIVGFAAGMLSTELWGPGRRDDAGA